MQPNKFILFDFDGVIIDSFESAFKIEKMLRKNDEFTKDHFRKNFEGNFFEEREKMQKVDYTPQQFYEAYQPIFIELQPVPHISEALQVLSESYPLIIISSAVTDNIHSWLEKNGLASYFVDILGADVHRSKVEKFKSVFESHHVASSDCVFITDTLGDIREADQLHIRTIAVTYGCHPKETLEKGKPFTFVDSPIELVDAVKRALS
jgi:phosphoglycolate phosphatase